MIAVVTSLIIALAVWRFRLNYRIYTRGDSAKAFNLADEDQMLVRSEEKIERLNDNGALLFLCLMTLYWSNGGLRSLRTLETKVNLTTTLSVLLSLLLFW